MNIIIDNKTILDSNENIPISLALVIKIVLPAIYMISGKFEFARRKLSPVILK